MLKYPLIILLLITNVAIAQKSTEFKPDLISGVVQYSVNITLYKTKTYTDTLKFNRKKSVFQWHLQNTVGKNSQDRNYANPKKKDSKIIKAAHKDSIGRVNLYDVTKDSLYSRKFLVDRVYLLKEKNPNIQWKIQDTTKKNSQLYLYKSYGLFQGTELYSLVYPRYPRSLRPLEAYRITRIDITSL